MTIYEDPFTADAVERIIAEARREASRAVMVFYEMMGFGFRRAPDKTDPKKAIR